MRACRDLRSGSRRGCRSGAGCAGTAARRKAAPGAVEMPALVIARDEGEVSKQIRSMCGLGDPAEQPQVLLLDLSSEGAFFTREPGTAAAPVCHGDACSIPGAAAVDEPFLRAFVADWRAGKLKRGKASKH